jgi:hypothetical protein
MRKHRHCGPLFLCYLCLSSVHAFLSSCNNLPFLSSCRTNNAPTFRPLFVGTNQQAENTTHISISPIRHRRQSRRQPESRRPKNYWKRKTNLQLELRQLWESVNVSIPQDQPPPIPNEALLNYWGRHDIRAAIVTNGGREELAEKLGGAQIIPGKWVNASQTPFVQELVASDPKLHAYMPPISPQQLKQITGTTADDSTEIEMEIDVLQNPQRQRWAYQDGRHPKGYWDQQMVIQELYLYLEQRRATKSIPAVWMPQLSALHADERDDLRQAIRRLVGGKKVGNMAGLVPYREWKYFEGMYDMMRELKRYLDEYHEGDYTFFPTVSHLKERGYEELWTLIQYYGGRNFVGARLGMVYLSQKKETKSYRELASADMNWGPFDLDFGIDLLGFVREEHLKKNPPMSYPELQFPSSAKLLASGERGIRLHEQTNRYGGYENVARRVGLAFNLRGESNN